MNLLSALSFGAPAALLALLALPAILWLLRLIPPRPRRIVFPPTALLADLVPTDRTRALTPWWLVLLRVGLALLLILALARPLVRPEPTAPLAGDGPLWLIVDDGWPAAADWPAIRTEADRILADAVRAGRPVALIGTVEGARQEFDPTGPEDAVRRLAVMTPRPLPDDRAALLPGLSAAAGRVRPGAIVWLSHGADLDAEADTRRFADTLARLAPDADRRVSRPAKLDAVALSGPETGADALTAMLARADDRAAAATPVRALDRRGRVLAETTATLAAGQAATKVRFAAPRALLDDVARLEVATPATAGGALLLDENARRRTVGLVGPTAADRSRPLLAPGHYLDSALAPFADLRSPRAADLAGSIDELLAPDLSVLILTDVGALSAEIQGKLDAWIRRGGVLVRFAGPRLAAARAGDPLLPVQLRQGERTLGGALTWGEPRRLGPFAAAGPFADMTPPDDVRVSRQILAEPAPDLAARTWASLDDGTPLVTAVTRGEGRIVLFHIGADTSWSSLPLSGGFVEMLRRITTLARGGVAVGSTRPLPPWRLLDGFGRLGAAGAEAKPLDRTAPRPRPSLERPPGLYGDDAAFVALPTVAPGDRLAPLPPIADFVATERRGGADTIDPTAALLVAALLLALIDGLVAFAPRIGLRRRTRAVVPLLLLAVLLVALPTRGRADEAGEAATRTSALSTRLAHVVTGDAETDDIAQRGLAALSRALSERTAFEPAEPIGIDPGRDELAVFPLIYWPIAPNAPPPDARALGRIDAYMKNGGLVVFDSRDAVEGSRRSPAAEALRGILSRLDLPELERLPTDHVLSRSFFLLRDFPGRFEAPRPWVEADRSNAEEDDRPLRSGDGVSSIVVTGADWIGAWAEDNAGDPLLPIGSDDQRAREMAFRVGINLVVYALTGNYKADQVHVPTLLQRLGR
jgi:hypothetical protein